MSATPGSQAVDRAAALLALVVESPTPRTFTSLVAELGLAKSTTSRLLQALERNRLVRRDRTGSYRAGALFAVYAARHPGDDLVGLVRPTLERLGQVTGETVNVAVPDGTSVAQVDQVDSRYLLGATNWVGVDVPGHCTALGKVFYAFGALPTPAGRLARRTARTLTSAAALARDLEEVRRLDYAVAWEELEPGLVAVAAPVRGPGGSIVAAISVSGPTVRLTRRRAARLGALLVTETRSLSTLLGFDGEEGVA